MLAEYELGEVIFSQKEIEDRAAVLGAEISKDYEGKQLILVGILRGAVMWMSEVMKHITGDVEIDFMALSSYGALTKSSGVVKINMDLNCDVTGKDVLIIEDIVDSGTTLTYLKGYLEGRNPSSVKICTLLDKPTGRRTELEADYVGFECPPVFIVGFGLDVNQKYRNLPYITSVVTE